MPTHAFRKMLSRRAAAKAPSDAPRTYIYHSEQKVLLQNKPTVKILFDELTSIMTAFEAIEALALISPQPSVVAEEAGATSREATVVAAEPEPTNAGDSIVEEAAVEAQAPVETEAEAPVEIDATAEAEQASSAHAIQDATHPSTVEEGEQGDSAGARAIALGMISEQRQQV